MSNRMDTIVGWRSLALSSGFSAEKMAQSLAISEKELRKYFADGLRLKLGTWLKQERYSEAARLIARNLPLKNVAEAVGIKNVSHLTRGFEAFYGLTPKQFRQDTTFGRSSAANGKTKQDDSLGSPANNGSGRKG